MFASSDSFEAFCNGSPARTAAWSRSDCDFVGSTNLPNIPTSTWLIFPNCKRFSFI
jgi:hypothetical protein